MRYLLLCLCLAACGGSDEKDSDPAPTYGTCDLRAEHHSCIEETAPARTIADQHAGCDDAGGIWSEDACPADELIGCCTYTFGNEFRECFYPGSEGNDPEGYCASWDDGVWTPG
jgi:hypothetical protein